MTAAARAQAAEALHLNKAPMITRVPTSPSSPQLKAKSCAALVPQQLDCILCRSYCRQLPFCTHYCVPADGEEGGGPYYCECVYAN